MTMQADYDKLQNIINIYTIKYIITAIILSIIRLNNYDEMSHLEAVLFFK